MPEIAKSKRELSVNSKLFRAYRGAAFRALPNEQIVKLLSEIVVQMKGLGVPTNQQKAVVQSFRDGLSDRGDTSNLTLATEATPETFLEFDPNDLCGFESEEPERTELEILVRDTAEKCLSYFRRTGTPPKLFGAYTTKDGQKIYQMASWKITFENGTLWNISGVCDYEEGRIPIHKCSGNVLVHENGSPVRHSQNFTGIDITQFPKESCFSGKSKKETVRGSVFVWLLRFKPKRHFEIWVNEKVPGELRGKDIERHDKSM